MFKLPSQRRTAVRNLHHVDIQYNHTMDNYIVSVAPNLGDSQCHECQRCGLGEEMSRND